MLGQLIPIANHFFSCEVLALRSLAVETVVMFETKKSEILDSIIVPVSIQVCYLPKFFTKIVIDSKAYRASSPTSPQDFRLDVCTA